MITRAKYQVSNYLILLFIFCENMAKTALWFHEGDDLNSANFSQHIVLAKILVPIHDTYK